MKFTPAKLQRGVSVMPLFEDAREEVLLECWEANTEVTLNFPNGAEILILEGSLTEAGETLGTHDWLRLPKNYASSAQSGADGVKFWIKRGHLAASPTAPG